MNIKKEFEYCGHDPQETSCPTCGECVLCTCDCERANTEIGENVMVAITPATTIEATIVSQNDDTITVIAIDEDFYGFGKMELGRYERYWWKV